VAKQNDDEVRKRLMREAAEEALAEAADRDPAVAKWLDDDFDQGMTEIMGMSPTQLQRELNDALPGITAAEVREAQQALKDAQAAAKGGWLSSPNPGKAQKILKSNGLLNKLCKKKGGWCAVVAVLMLTIGGSTVAAAIYGAVEIIASH